MFLENYIFFYFKTPCAKLKKDPELLHDYNNIVKEQLSAGIIEKIKHVESKPGTVHHLPHRTVVRKQKETTKVRMVFDASASINGVHH